MIKIKDLNHLQQKLTRLFKPISHQIKVDSFGFKENDLAEKQGAIDFFVIYWQDSEYGSRYIEIFLFADGSVSLYFKKERKKHATRRLQFNNLSLCFNCRLIIVRYILGC